MAGMALAGAIPALAFLLLLAIVPVHNGSVLMLNNC